MSTVASTARQLVIRLLVVALVASGLTTLQAATASAPATAAPVTDFTPGNIISDAVMYDSSTMNAAAVQTFLNSKGASCSPASGNTCVKSYRENTPNRAADSLCTRAYSGGSNETAATIIAKVSAACGINPQVLLVTLQKEQGLITATAGKSARTYARALGFGCPDNVGGWCDPSYAGFANQVYSAAKQLKRYAANPTGYSYRAGRTNTIQWHPNASCGSTQVYIENQATAGLYNYTPYAPNAAALAAGYGSGDSCSSYGNRNFHLYFQSWFGAPVNRAPFGVVDGASSAAGSGSISVRGWALDPDTSASISVHVYVDGKAVRAAKASLSRPDVERAYGNGAAHGFDVSVPATAGSHSVCVYAIDSAGGANTSLGCRSVDVTSRAPVGSLDVASAGPGRITVRGWALDPDTSDSISVQVQVDGKTVRTTTATTSRTDIGRKFGLGDAHGYQAVVPAANGSRTVCVQALDASQGTPTTIGCKTLSVTNLAPRGAYDLLSSPAPGSVRIRGWAFDPDSSAAIDVHVYVDKKRTTSLKAGTARPDVARAYGVGSNHGFDSTIALRAGSHSVCLYALDSTGGTNPSLGCKTVVVANTPTAGALEPTTTAAAALGSAARPATRATVTTSGWAWDFDSDAPVTVEMLIDGTVVATGTADTRRAAVPGASRTNIGFTLRSTAVPGARSVCVRATDPTTSEKVELGCTTTDVPNSAAFGVVDAVTPSSGGFSIRGWAMDPDTAGAVQVHVYVDGVRVDPILTAGASRPDVDAVYGNGPLHGFSGTFAAKAGPRTVCVYAIGVPTRTPNPRLVCQPITVS